jgi:hypothetical protein
MPGCEPFATSSALVASVVKVAAIESPDGSV